MKLLARPGPDAGRVALPSKAYRHVAQNPAIEMSVPGDNLPHMNKTAVLTTLEVQHKALADGYLADAQRILRGLAAERRRTERRRTSRSSILTEVRAILQGA